jgi:hypothetical protein
MNTPGKEAYTRKTAKAASKPTYNRKKAVMSGADARSAYKRKKQPASAASVVASRLRQRLAGGAD